MTLYVALLAEGVDRNFAVFYDGFSDDVVALLAEGVDRNLLKENTRTLVAKSPSSRRAWIEIRWSACTAGRAFGRPPRGGRG